MSKIAAAIVFAMVTVLTSAAHAKTLTINDGDIEFFPVDVFASFSGDGVSVSMSFGGTPVGTERAFGVATFVLGFQFGGVDTGGAAVNVGAESCHSSISVVCGQISLTSPGLTPRPADWPPDVNFTATAPFTALGHLDVGDGHDFLGQGLLEGLWCGDFPQQDLRCFSNGSPQVLVYTFSQIPVAEPPTGLLVVVALSVIGALLSARSLRDRHAARLPEHP